MARHIKLLALALDGKVVASFLHWDKEHSEDYIGAMRRTLWVSRRAADALADDRHSRGSCCR